MTPTLTSVIGDGRAGVGPRRLVQRVRRTLAGRKNYHGLFVVMLGERPQEPRFGMVGVAVGVAVLVAHGGGSDMSVSIAVV